MLQTMNLTRAALLALISCLGAGAPGSAEDWHGYEGGGPKHNASKMDIHPERLAVTWIRSFENQVIIGKGPGPASEESRTKWGSLHGAYGSRNLVLMDGRIALIAADHLKPIAPNLTDTAWLTLLDAKDGSTLNCVQVSVKPGKAGLWGWPQAPWTDANDLLIGQVVLDWDKETNACFLSIGGDGALYTAYLPTANLETYVHGDFQMAIPAFQRLVDEHEGLQDSFGTARSDLISVYRPVASQKVDPAEAAHYGPTLIPVDQENERKPLDTRIPLLLPHPGSDPTAPSPMVIGNYQNTNCNRTGFITIDLKGPTLAMGQSWHSDASSYYFANKWSGLSGMSNPLPPLRLVDEAGVAKDHPHPRPFAKWGGLIAHNNRLYGMSPGTDDDHSGTLGLSGGPGWQITRRDQGLGLWAYDLTWEDLRENGGAAGPAAAETLTAKQAWGWSRKTNSHPKALNESWFEADGLYRNKAMLVDDAGSLWATWTRSVDDGLELVRADESGQAGWLLGIGKGRPGHETWPHLALANLESEKLLVSYAGNAWHRSRGPHTLAHSNCARPAGAEIVDAWVSEDEPPSGSPELAVFSTSNHSVVARHDLSQFADDIPPNEFFGYTDRTHLVIAGEHAYVGWVSTKHRGNAELVLCAFHLKRPADKPVLRRFHVGFDAEAYPASALIDLIAANGKLFALVYRSHDLHYGDPRWSAQVLVSIGNPEDSLH